jgi:2,3-bisphosphoglycerate-independent phosphoglycerate mutase
METICDESISLKSLSKIPIIIYGCAAAINPALKGKGFYSGGGKLNMEMVLKACFGSIDSSGALRAKNIFDPDSAYLAETIDGLEIDGIRFSASLAGSELVIKMEGENLSDEIKGNYIEKPGLPVAQILFTHLKARFTANTLNKFLRRANKILSGEPVNREKQLPANIVLIRDAEVAGKPGPA